MIPTAHAVIRGGHRYGAVRHELDGTWTGCKAGEFGTVRSGFDTREAAEEWVLTNRAHLVAAYLAELAAA